MADDNLTMDEIRQRAADAGLTRLTEEHLQQLLRATKAARARRATLPVGTLGAVDEPAHVFRLDGGGQPSSPSLLPDGEGSKLSPLSLRERGRE